MDKILAPIKQRILQFIDYKGITKGYFFEKLNISASNFRSQSLFSEVGGDVIAKISSEYPEINPEWLITGNGNMIRDDLPKIENLQIKSVRKTLINKVEEQLVPYYAYQASAGIQGIFTEEKKIPLDYIKVPNLPKCDGAVRITGDSMYPLLKSGDIVLYKEGHSKDFIIWGEMYLVYIECDGEEYFAVKYLQKSDKEGYIRLISYNDHHQEKEFPIDCLRKWALVKASIRINSTI